MQKKTPIVRKALFQHKKIWFIGSILLIILLIIVVRGIIQARQKTRLFKLEDATFNLWMVKTQEDTKIHLTTSSFERIPRIAQAVKPSYDFTVTNLFGTEYKELSAPFVITINYTDDNLDEIHENTLAIYRFDKNQPDRYEKLNTTLNTQKKQATAQTNKLGRFSLMGDLKVLPPPVGFYTQEFPFSEWKTTQNTTLGFSVRYPPNWRVDNETYSQETGSIKLSALGDDQAAGPIGTELFDGVIFSLNIYPNEGNSLSEETESLSVGAWHGPPTREVKYEQVGNYNFHVGYHCGDRLCDSTYITFNKGRIYRFDILAVGKNAQLFNSVATKIIRSIELE